MKHTKKTEQGGRSDVWCIGLFVSSMKTSITLREKMRYLTFKKINTPNNFSHC